MSISINNNMTTNILQEGLRAGDLADLVLPLISVDEFESKVDPKECIVFGFYVHDKDAAKDLNRFLQKSATPLMDTDLSPAPDQHGYFIVFIELMDNSTLAENMVSILAELKELVDIDDDGWQMRVRGTKELLAFSEKNLKEAIADAKKAIKHEEVKEWLKSSILTNVLFEGDLIILEYFKERYVHEMLNFGDTPTILMEQNLMETPILFNIKTVAKMNRLKAALGENWEVLALGKKHILVQFDDEPKSLLLKV